jgi:hypothetical protein
MMTDEEYSSFIKALARIHLGHFRVARERADDTRRAFDRVSATVRLWKLARELDAEGALLNQLLEQLEVSPVADVRRIMDGAGLLDALDEAPSLVFGQFRRSAIPPEDMEILRQAGFSDDEIEVLLAVAVDQAHALAGLGLPPSSVVADAEEALRHAIKTLSSLSMAVEPQKKKRKLFNGIGKLLGGSAAGIGNILLLTGSIVAPNPASLYAAIASGGIAVSTFFAGIGDLRGE